MKWSDGPYVCSLVDESNVLMGQCIRSNESRWNAVNYELVSIDGVYCRVFRSPLAGSPFDTVDEAKRRVEISISAN